MANPKLCTFKRLLSCSGFSVIKKGQQGVRCCSESSVRKGGGKWKERQKALEEQYFHRHDLC